MKSLFLIRHAKSVHGLGMADFDRPLTESGFIDAALVAEKAHPLFTEGAIVLSSPAKRTRDTASIFARRFPAVFASVEFPEDLYTFDRNQLEEVIRSSDNSADRLIVIGHNEAVTDFVNKFGDIAIDNVPTCGLVQITFDTDSWKNIGNGKTIGWIFPKDLRT